MAEKQSKSIKGGYREGSGRPSGVPNKSTTLAREAIANFVDGNALLVDENRNHSDWAKFIEKLVKNPNMAKDMGERLYETVKDKYDLNVVTKARAEFYKSIV
jgi:glycosyltransferase involved in cell wall biosynthesis